MSLIHYTPDTTVVPCLGCNELIENEDLVQVTQHGGLSTFFWHPYHFWCVREDDHPMRWWLACADCGDSLDADALRAAITWASTFDIRVRARMIRAPGGSGTVNDPSAARPRPQGLRLCLVAPQMDARRSPEWLDPQVSRRFAEWGRPPVQIPRRDWRQELGSLLGQELLTVLEGLRFEFVHDACPTVDSFIATLRTTRPTESLLAVYGDWLLQQGYSGKAEFVRVCAERLGASSSRRGELKPRLRELRHCLPGSWCRVVLGA